MIDDFPVFDLHVHTHHSSCACQRPAYRVEWILAEDSRLFSRDDIFAFYRLAKDTGVRLSFGTDSHQPVHLTSIVPLVATARSIGLAPDDFVHDFPQPPTRRPSPAPA